MRYSLSPINRWAETIVEYGNRRCPSLDIIHEYVGLYTFRHSCWWTEKKNTLDQQSELNHIHLDQETETTYSSCPVTIITAGLHQFFSPFSFLIYSPAYTSRQSGEVCRKWQRKSQDKLFKRILYHKLHPPAIKSEICVTQTTCSFVYLKTLSS